MTFSETELRTIFASSCIESAARASGCSASEMYARMNKIGLVENYIWKYYDQLHSESREHLTEDILETLRNWEKRQDGK